MDEDIKKKVEAAIRAGAPKDQAVRRGLSLQEKRTKKSGIDINNPDFSQSEKPQERGLLSSIFHGVVDPFARTLGNIGTAAITVPQAAIASVVSKKNPELAAKIASQDILGTQKVAEEISKDPKKALVKQVKDSANVASYAIPFGKGANIATKALLPGAAVGAVQEATTNDEADIGSVAKSALFGAGTAGAFQFAGKVLGKARGKISKAGKVAEKQAAALNEGTRQIKVKPSISGAGQEKAINSTLDRLGFKGSAQKQYESLEPAMQKLEGEIQTIVKNNPAVTVAKEDIKSSFLEKLKSSLRSKDFTNKQAISEVEGYLKDLLKASGGKGKFTNIDLERLRILKKLVNEDYGAVNAIKARGGTLTARQKVIDVAWSSLDDAVKNASPEMKALLKDESNLFKAASSLSGARSNPPTLRGVGTSIPASAVQVGRDAASGILKGSAKKAEAISKIPNVSPSGQTIVGQMVSRLPSALGEETENTEQNNQNNKVGNNQFYNQNEFSFDSSVPQPTQQENITGRSVERWLKMKSKATAAGDKAAVSEIDKQLKIEQEYQETAGGGSGLNVTKVSAQNYSNSLSGDKSLQNTMGLIFDESGKLNRGVIAALKTPGTPSQKARQLKAELYNVADSYLRLRTGATANPTEIQKLANSLEPGLLDTSETVATKLAIYKQVFDAVLNLSKDGGLEQDLGGFSVQ